MIRYLPLALLAAGPARAHDLGAPHLHPHPDPLVIAVAFAAAVMGLVLVLAER